MRDLHIRIRSRIGVSACLKFLNVVGCMERGKLDRWKIFVEKLNKKVMAKRKQSMAKTVSIGNIITRK